MCNKLKPITPTPVLNIADVSKFVDNLERQSERKDVKEAWDRCRKKCNKYNN
ncbi:MAG: hypothetical protein KAK00_00355 [Nanoarchaeota archaeon]|nr:hypothetical protein [Nanoarchaeota archaeon]